MLRAMADAGVLLLVHGEVTDNHVDMFDREAVFIREKLVRGTTRGEGSSVRGVGKGGICAASVTVWWCSHENCFGA